MHVWDGGTHCPSPVPASWHPPENATTPPAEAAARSLHKKKSNKKVGGACQCVWPTEHVKSERGHVSMAMQTRLRSDQVCCQATS
jgi:hypothetical protein